MLIAVKISFAQGNSGYQTKTDEYGRKHDVYNYSPNTGTQYNYNKKEEKHYSSGYSNPQAMEAIRLQERIDAEKREKENKMEREKEQKALRDIENAKDNAIEQERLRQAEAIRKAEYKAYIEKGLREKYDVVLDFTTMTDVFEVKRDRKWGLVNKNTGDFVTDIKYDTIENYTENRWIAKGYLNWVYLDNQGNEVTTEVPLRTGELRIFEGLGIVQINDKYGFADQTGKVIIPPKYTNVNPFYYNKAVVSIDHQYGYIDRSGKMVIPMIYSNAQNFCEGFANVKKGDKWGFIDESGNALTGFIYDDEHSFFSQGMAVAEKDGKYGYIDITGKEVIPLKYDGADFFSSGLAPVEQNDKYGYINKAGELIIPFQYDYASYFSEGLALVELDNKTTWIDINGKMIRPFKTYFEANTFFEGKALVKEENGNGESADTYYIDKNGERIR